MKAIVNILIWVGTICLGHSQSYFDYFRVDKIDSTDNAYIIEITTILEDNKNGGWCAIISLKDNCLDTIGSLPKIKVGHYYFFSIDRVDYIQDVSHYMPFIWHLTINSTEVKFRNTRRLQSSVFVTTNCLCGLYYTCKNISAKNY